MRENKVTRKKKMSIKGIAGEAYFGNKNGNASPSAAIGTEKIISQKINLRIGVLVIFFLFINLFMNNIVQHKHNGKQGKQNGKNMMISCYGV